MARALVTGASGFIGANLVRALVADRHEVIAVHRDREPGWRLQGILDSSQLTALPLDLQQINEVEEALSAAKPDWVFHLAAHGAYSWQTNFSTMLRVNVEATEAILRYARTTGASMVYAGSSSEYGFQEAPPLESSTLKPNSLYSVTKAAGTHLCLMPIGDTPPAATVLRLYSAYGPYEEPGRLVPTLLAHAQLNSWPPLVSPMTARDFVWIGDVCEAFLLAAKSTDARGRVFNVASGTQTSLGELVDLVSDIHRVSVVPDWGTMPQREWDTNTWVGDYTSIREKLGWEPKTSLRQGLDETSRWIQDYPGRGLYLHIK